MIETAPCKKENKAKVKLLYSCSVSKFPSCWVLVITRQENEKLGSSLTCSFFLFFPLKQTGANADSGQQRSLALVASPIFFLKFQPHY